MLNKNMRVTFRFGLKILCDGYVIAGTPKNVQTLIFSTFLCDGYVMQRLI